MARSMKITALLLVAMAAAASADFRVVVSGVGDNRAQLKPAFNKFKKLLGGGDNGNSPGPFPDGHRTVNWDAPIVPFNMPATFFKDVVTRGLTVSNRNDKFRVSNPADNTDRKFDSINPDAAENFARFSPKRLFSPLSDNRLEVTFTVPGQPDAAVVTGFGAVYVDVEDRKATKAIYYDVNNRVLTSQKVDPNKGGLSFLGVVFDEPILARVVIQLGQDALGDKSARGDIVVMDDFAYGEPQSVAPIMKAIPDSTARNVTEA